MCNFLSAIALRNGDIFCDPASTDSHEDLIEYKGLVNNDKETFVRVEYVPPDD